MNVKDWDTQVELARTAVETAFQVADEMADRNEQLEERNKELTLQLLATSGQAADALDKLAKAVEALQNISCHANYHLSRFASAVLAELEAKNE